MTCSCSIWNTYFCQKFAPISQFSKQNIITFWIINLLWKWSSNLPSPNSLILFIFNFVTYLFLPNCYRLLWIFALSLLKNLCNCKLLRSKRLLNFSTGTEWWLECLTKEKRKKEKKNYTLKLIPQININHKKQILIVMVWIFF